MSKNKFHPTELLLLQMIYEQKEPIFTEGIDLWRVSPLLFTFVSIQPLENAGLVKVSKVPNRKEWWYREANITQKGIKFVENEIKFPTEE